MVGNEDEVHEEGNNETMKGGCLLSDWLTMLS